MKKDGNKFIVQEQKIRINHRHSLTNKNSDQPAKISTATALHTLLHLQNLLYQPHLKRIA